MEQIKKIILFFIGLMFIRFDLSPTSNDAPEPWGLFFPPDFSTPQMEDLQELHNNIMFYLALTLFAVSWILLSTILNSYKATESDKGVLALIFGLAFIFFISYHLTDLVLFSSSDVSDVSSVDLEICRSCGDSNTCNCTHPTYTTLTDDNGNPTIDDENKRNCCRPGCESDDIRVECNFCYCKFCSAECTR